MEVAWPPSEAISCPVYLFWFMVVPLWQVLKPEKGVRNLDLLVGQKCRWQPGDSGKASVWSGRSSVVRLAFAWGPCWLRWLVSVRNELNQQGHPFGDQRAKTFVGGVKNTVQLVSESYIKEFKIASLLAPLGWGSPLGTLHSSKHIWKLIHFLSFYILSAAAFGDMVLFFCF